MIVFAFYAYTVLINTVYGSFLPKDIANLIIKDPQKQEFLSRSPGNELLHFPATGRVQFIRSSSNNNYFTKKEYLNIKEKSKILPDLQLWSRCNRCATRIDKDTDNIKTNWAYYNTKLRKPTDEEVLAFDSHYNSIFNQWYCVVFHTNHISFRCISNKEGNMRLVDTPINFTIAPSICFHQIPDQEIVSYIGQNHDQLIIDTYKKTKSCLDFFKDEDLKEDKQYFNYTQTFVQLALHQTVNEPKTTVYKPMQTITKHEYIGAKTYFVLMNNQLFLGVVENNILNLYVQTIKSITNEPILIESFAVNHDDNKKTKAGRCQFFSLLSTTGTVYLGDLWSNRLLPIGDIGSYKEERRLSFDGDTISIWIPFSKENYRKQQYTVYRFIDVFHPYYKKLFTQIEAEQLQVNTDKNENELIKSYRSNELNIIKIQSLIRRFNTAKKVQQLRNTRNLQALIRRFNAQNELKKLQEEQRWIQKLRLLKKTLIYSAIMTTIMYILYTIGIQNFITSHN